MLDSVQADISAQIESMKDPTMRLTKMNTLSDEVLDEQSAKDGVREKILESKFEEFRKQVKEILHKEENYENNLINQERDRIECEEKQILNDQTYETLQANKLVADIQAIAERESKLKVKEKRIRREMQDMMAETQNQIAVRRQRLLERIKGMRMMHELKKRQSAKEMLVTKRNIGLRFAKLTKLGNPLQCFNSIDLVHVNTYCNTFVHDLDTQTECRKPKSFCYVCCDNEIGAMNKEHLDCCYNRCDTVPHAGGCVSFAETYHLAPVQGIAAPVLTPNPPVVGVPTPVAVAPAYAAAPSPFPAVGLPVPPPVVADPIVAIPREY